MKVIRLKTLRPIGATGPKCEGVHMAPMERVKASSAEWTAGTYSHKHGIVMCSVCFRWFAASQTGTPIYHKRGGV